MQEPSDKERIAELERRLAALEQAVVAWADTTSHMQSAFEDRFSIIRKFMDETPVFFSLLGIVSLVLAGRANVSESELEKDLTTIASNPNIANELAEAIRFWVSNLPRNIKIAPPPVAASETNPNRPKWFRGIFQDGAFVPRPEE